jgi:hypothetical protein
VTALDAVLLHLQGRSGDVIVSHYGSNAPPASGTWSCSVHLAYVEAVRGTGDTLGQALEDAARQLGAVTGDG